jgi:hypothetical protein
LAEKLRFHEAQFISLRICAPLVVQLLKQFRRFYIKIEIIIFMYTSILNQIWARSLATMVAETASIVVGGSPNKTN